eukprot:6180730-Pleurochrysis_carterae.AAC.2
MAAVLIGNTQLVPSVDLTSLRAVQFSVPAVSASVPTDAELARLTQGYARIEYLLKNWDEVRPSSTR